MPTTSLTNKRRSISPNRHRVDLWGNKEAIGQGGGIEALVGLLKDGTLADGLENYHAVVMGRFGTTIPIMISPTFMK